MCTDTSVRPDDARDVPGAGSIYVYYLRRWFDGRYEKIDENGTEYRRFCFDIYV